ncbi:hypothetical protein MCC93_27460 [Morococcus cerebrosus]|uniref:Uncharacterized protein n=1 Tax=Morococcus cerebrosus TaxID=1056807 RepID=A0A0C1GVF0_9NEIS|nr:hypothetical protein MCC93_27460 [Morococcus cerebrosus]
MTLKHQLSERSSENGIPVFRRPFLSLGLPFADIVKYLAHIV